MKKIFFLSLFVILLFCSITLADNIVNIQGAATVAYKGKEATPQDKQKAFLIAEQNAIDKYYSEKGSSYINNFNKIQQTVFNNISNYILSSNIISQQDNKDFKIYQISLNVELNLAALNNALQQVASNHSLVKSSIAFFFVARSVSSEKIYETRKYQRADVKYNGYVNQNNSKSGSETQSINNNSIGVGSGVNNSNITASHVSKVVETGGSNYLQATKYKYNIINSEYIDTIVSGNFAESGFNVVEASFIAPEAKAFINVDQIKKEYESGDLNPKTLFNMAEGMRLLSIPYLALATLDVGLPYQDPDTGLEKVYVTVTGSVYNVTNRFPIVVVKVGPEQYAGIGPTENVAQINALKLAAKQASEEIISRMNAKSIY